MTDTAPDSLAAALEGIRERADRASALVTAAARAAVDAREWNEANVESAADVPRLLEGYGELLKIHRPFRIYEPCDHDHTEEDIAAGRAVDTYDFVSCEELYLYSVCAFCCRDNFGQSESCAGAHDNSQCWPCPTYMAISAALSGEDGSE